jgi:hypothetical protein
VFSYVKRGKSPSNLFAADVEPALDAFAALLTLAKGFVAARVFTPWL